MKAGCAPACCRTTISPAYIAKCSMNKVHRQLRCAAVRAGQQLHLHVQCTAELHQRHLPARVGTFSKPATSSGNLDFRFQNCCGWPAAHQCHSTSLQCHGPRPDGLPRYKLCLESPAFSVPSRSHASAASGTRRLFHTFAHGEEAVLEFRRRQAALRPLHCSLLSASFSIMCRYLT